MSIENNKKYELTLISNESTVSWVENLNKRLHEIEESVNLVEQITGRLKWVHLDPTEWLDEYEVTLDNIESNVKLIISTINQSFEGMTKTISNTIETHHDCLNKFHENEKKMLKDEIKMLIEEKQELIIEVKNLNIDKGRLLEEKDALVMEYNENVKGLTAKMSDMMNNQKIYIDDLQDFLNHRINSIHENINEKFGRNNFERLEGE